MADELEPYLLNANPERDSAVVDQAKEFLDECFSIFNSAHVTARAGHFGSGLYKIK